MIKVFFIFKVICLFTAIIITFANQNPVYAVLHLVTFFVTGSFLLIFLGVDFLPYVFIIVYAGAVAVLFLFIVIILKIKLGSTQINYRNIIIIFFSSIGLSSLTYSLTFINYEIYNGRIIDLKQEPDDQPENPIYFTTPYQQVYSRVPWDVPGTEQTLKNFRYENGKAYITTSFWADNEKGETEFYEIELPLIENYTSYCLATAYNKTQKNLVPYPCHASRVVHVSDENFNIYDIQSNLTNLGKILYTEYNIHFIVCGLILLVAIIGAISLTRGYNTSISLKQKIFIQTTRSSIIGKITL